jgi:outer membrane lipoprotein SlyB
MQAGSVPSSAIGSVLESMLGSVLESVIGGILGSILGSLLGNVLGGVHGSDLRAYLGAYSLAGWKCTIECNQKEVYFKVYLGAYNEVHLAAWFQVCCM